MEIDIVSLKQTPLTESTQSTSSSLESSFGIKELFESNIGVQATPKPTRPLYEGNLNEVAAVNGDFLGAIRKVDGVYNSVMNHSDNINGFNGLAFGLGAIQAGTGILSFQGSCAGVQTSLDNGDKVGLVTSSIGVVQGVSASISGAGSAAISGVSIVEQTNKMTKVLQGLGKLSIIAGGFVGVVGIVREMTNLIESFSLMKSLLKVSKNKPSKNLAVETLQNMLSITNSDKKQILDQLFSEKKVSWKSHFTNSFNRVLFKKDQNCEKKKFIFEQNLQKILKNPECLEELNKDTQEDTPSPTKEQRFIANYIQCHPSFQNLKVELREKLVCLLHPSYEKALLDLKSKKEAIFKRVIGVESYNLMQPLLDKNVAKIPDLDKTALLKAVKRGVYLNRMLNIGIIALNFMGIAAIGMVQLATGGSYALIGLAMSLLIAVGWATVDSYALYQAFKNNVATTKDKIFMVMTILGTFAATVVGAVIAETINELVPLIIMTALCSMVMLYCVYSWSRSSASNLLKASKNNRLTNKRRSSVVL